MRILLSISAMRVDPKKAALERLLKEAKALYATLAKKSVVDTERLRNLEQKIDALDKKLFWHTLGH